MCLGQDNRENRFKESQKWGAVKRVRGKKERKKRGTENEREEEERGREKQKLS